MWFSSDGLIYVCQMTLCYHIWKEEFHQRCEISIHTLDKAGDYFLVFGKENMNFPSKKCKKDLRPVSCRSQALVVFADMYFKFTVQEIPLRV